MYKTRFKSWGVKKYGVDKTTTFFDQEVRRLHARSRRSQGVRSRRPVHPAELPHYLEALELDTYPGTNTTEHANPSVDSQYVVSSSAYLDIPFSSSETSCQSTAMSSVNYTPDRSRDTSRPSSSNSASLLTPESSGSWEEQCMPPLMPRGSDLRVALVRNQNFPRNVNVVESHGFGEIRASPIPRSVPKSWMEVAQSDGSTIAGQIVNHVMGFCAPSTFRTPNPDKTFQNLMTAPLDGSIYRSDAFRTQLGDMRSIHQDRDLVSPQPETWINLCFYINFLLVQDQTSEANYAMRRAASIYQRLAQERNIGLLSILNLVLTNLFLYRKQGLAAELLSHARAAASRYLDEQDPIMVSITFMVSMALKNTKNCGIRILQLRYAASEMKKVWGENHPFCVTADYNLAWRLAMESDLRWEALEILRQTQVRAEHVFDRLHMQTVALITTQARVLSHLGRPLEAERTMSEALQRIQSWDIAEDYPYYMEAKRRHGILVEEVIRIRSR
jgi:hypothetical protein